MNQMIKERILAQAEAVLPMLKQLRTDLYHHPETGGEERFASNRLVEILEQHGFDVMKDFGNIPYAFQAVCSSGKTGPTVGIFAEYDALPGLGHACGHNLICSAALGAAIALQPVMNELCGSIIVYGTPGEENLCTKTTLAEQGYFDTLDAAIMVHPNPTTCGSGTTRAIEALQIEFWGQSAHAGADSNMGINALDAAVDCYQEIRRKKAQYPNASICGIISNGGLKASTIPDYSCLKYLTRAWNMDELKALRQMVEDCAGRAAEAVGCTYRITNNEATNQPMHTNRALSQVFDRYLLEFGEPDFMQEDVAGSTDMADVSWRVPAIHPWVGLNCPNARLHTKEFAEMTLGDDADMFLERCSKTLACTAAEVLTNEELLLQIKAEFEKSAR